MKKLLLTLFGACFASAGFAQPFILTVDGFRDSKDTTKDYIVVAVPDCDKSTLFQRARNYFTMIYNSPHHVMSESGTDMISILGSEEIIYAAGKMVRSECKFSYKLVCEFRDGRSKITPSWVDLTEAGKSYPIQSYGLLLGIFRKNGKIREEKARTQIEKIISTIVEGLEKALKEEYAPSTEDW